MLGGRCLRDLPVEHVELEREDVGVVGRRSVAEFDPDAALEPVDQSVDDEVDVESVDKEVRRVGLQPVEHVAVALDDE